MNTTHARRTEVLNTFISHSNRNKYTEADELAQRKVLLVVRSRSEQLRLRAIQVAALEQPWSAENAPLHFERKWNDFERRRLRRRREHSRSKSAGADANGFERKLTGAMPAARLMRCCASSDLNIETTFDEETNVAHESPKIFAPVNPKCTPRRRHGEHCLKSSESGCMHASRHRSMKA
jgi:hypothetical protein